MQSLNIIFTGKDQVEVSQEPLKEMGANDFLVRSTQSLISTGTESICLGRLFDAGTHWDAWVKYPFHPGYSLIGQVVAVGKNVSVVHEGERIALRHNHRQYTVVPDTEHIYRIPDAVSDEDAAWFHMATIAQVGVRRAEHTLGDAVVVVGLGLLGQLVVQYARLLGARQIIGIDIAERRLEMARVHGATTILNMDVEQARKEVLRLTEGLGVNVVYDITGAAPVFSQALQLLRSKGRMVLLGDTGSPEKQHLTKDVITQGLSIVGAHDMHGEFPATDSSFWNNVRQSELFLNFLQRGEMRVQDLITHRYSPLAAPEAYSMLRRERATAMGVIFDWTQLI
jgi:2-desacetyl-2-hydroxyethyl bacteriochlorophyllide A dehydrogenase